MGPVEIYDSREHITSIFWAFIHMKDFFVAPILFCVLQNALAHQVEGYFRNSLIGIFDFNKNGEVTQEDFRYLASFHEGKISKRNMEAAFYGDENLSFLEEENRFKTSNKIIADIYSFYDTDGNGFLDPTEVGELIEKWD